MKHTAVKIWVTIALVLIAAYTGFAVLRATRDRIAASGELPGRHLANSYDGASTPQDVLADAADASDDRKPVDDEQPVTLEELAMTERSGEEFAFSELKGKVWIANMFFASCPHQCRDLNLAVRSLAEDKRFKDVQFVSVTVDPKSDTPKVLRDYAKLFDADPEHWLFLTAEMSVVEKFGSGLLKVPVAKQVHTDRLAVFDRQGRLRGAFRFGEADQMAQLRKLVPKLLAEPIPESEPADSAAAPDEPIDGGGDA